MLNITAEYSLRMRLAPLITETAMFGKFAPGPTAQLPPDPGDGVAEARDDCRQQPHRDRGQIQEIYG